LSHNPGLEPPIRTLIDRYKPKRILDVACGRGEWFYQRPLAEWVGIDIWLPYLQALALEERNIEHVRGIVTHLPFQQRSFDLVLCIEILEHLTAQDGLRMFDEAKRVARKVVIVTTPTDPLGRHLQDVLNQNPHERHVTRISGERLVEQGFRIHTVRTQDPKWDEFLVGVCEI
jgi:ubiquinone/menaquinone biosynthesis C-methylase UbiE